MNGKMMMRSSTLSLLRQSLKKNDHRRIQLESCRGMTVLSKESGEEFKKQVSQNKQTTTLPKSTIRTIIGSHLLFWDQYVL